MTGVSVRWECVGRRGVVRAVMAVAALWGSAACDETSDPDAAVVSDASLDGGAEGGEPSEAGVAVDASATQDGSTVQDAAASYPATEQTVQGTCEGELIQRDYPVTVTATGFEVPDGTAVYGYIGFGIWTSGYAFCSVTGQTQTQGGGFRLELMATTHGEYFPSLAFWIDLDGDGQCSLSETVFRTSPYGMSGLTVELTAEEVADDVENDDRDTACEPFDELL